MTPQNWLFQGSYKSFVEGFFRASSGIVVAKLGTECVSRYELVGGNDSTPGSFSVERQPVLEHSFAGMDVAERQSIKRKRPNASEWSPTCDLSDVATHESRRASHLAIAMVTNCLALLSDAQFAFKDLRTGDYPHYGRFLGDVPVSIDWAPLTEHSRESTALWWPRDSVSVVPGTGLSDELAKLGIARIQGSAERGVKRGLS